MEHSCGFNSAVCNCFGSPAGHTISDTEVYSIHPTPSGYCSSLYLFFFKLNTKVEITQ